MFERFKKITEKDLLDQRLAKEAALSIELGNHTWRYVRIAESEIIASEPTLRELIDYAPHPEVDYYDQLVLPEQEGANFFSIV